MAMTVRTAAKTILDADIVKRAHIKFATAEYYSVFTELLVYNGQPHIFGTFYTMFVHAAEVYGL